VVILWHRFVSLAIVREHHEEDLIPAKKHISMYLAQMEGKFTSSQKKLASTLHMAQSCTNLMTLTSAA